MTETNISRESSSNRSSGARVVSFSPVVFDEGRPLRVYEPQHPGDGDTQKHSKDRSEDDREQDDETGVSSMYATVGVAGKSTDDGLSNPSLPPPRTFTDPEEEPANDVDISRQDRDPTDMNGDILVAFADIFAEPEGLHSEDDVWVCTYKTYKGSKYWCYRICTLICAVPAAILWGISFACLAFCHIWCVVPFIKAFLIQLKCFGRIFAICVRTCCDPLYTSFALMFSRIRVNFNRSEGSEGNFYSKYEQGLY